MRLSPLFAALVLIAVPSGALSASPTETVRAFYDNPGLETDPAARETFADPARTILDQNDAIRKSGQDGCLDPGLALDNTPATHDEIKASLKLAEAVDGSEAKVIVAFHADSEPHRMEWKLRAVGGIWKVYDLLSVTGEWALSQFGCE